MLWLTSTPPTHATGEGALVMVEHKLPHAMTTFINSAPHSLFSSRFQFAALMSLFKQGLSSLA